MSPKKGLFQQEMHLPTISFQGICRVPRREMTQLRRFLGLGEFHLSFQRLIFQTILGFRRDHGLHEKGFHAGEFVCFNTKIYQNQMSQQQMKHIHSNIISYMQYRIILKGNNMFTFNHRFVFYNVLVNALMTRNCVHHTVSEYYFREGISEV